MKLRLPEIANVSSLTCGRKCGLSLTYHTVKVDLYLILHLDRTSANSDWLDPEFRLLEHCRPAIVKLSIHDAQIDSPRLSMQHQVAQFIKAQHFGL